MLRGRSCAPAALLLLKIPTGIPRRRALLGRRLGRGSLTLFRRRCPSSPSFGSAEPAAVVPETACYTFWTMVRVLLGIIKGGVVGAAVGLAAMQVKFGTGAGAWLVYGLIGFLVGIICGKAIWRHETLVTPLLKGIFGFLLGMGLYWLAGKTLGNVAA